MTEAAGRREEPMVPQLSENTIKMNFANAARQAEQLEQLAAELSRLAGDDLTGSLQSLAGSWNGDSSSLFLQKGAALAEQMHQSAQALQDAANDIYSIARRTYDAEMQALELARVREA